MLGTPEIVVIGGVVLMLFGASAIPKFFRSLGKAKSEFEKGIKEAKDDVQGAIVDEGSGGKQVAKE